MNQFKTKKYILPRACVLVVLILLYVNNVWAGDASDLSSEPQTDVTFKTDEAAGDVEDEAWDDEENWDDEWEEGDTIADPLEPLNRFFFHFNDKLYYWVLKPVTRVYSGIIPEELQVMVRNFFDNLRSPTRVVNCLLQGQVQDSSVELARFGLNSTLGIIGFVDFAKDVLDLLSTREDTGQTLGFYGAGGGFYINWPFLGPSNFRDSLGLIGDAYLHPIIFLDASNEVIIGMWTFEKVNQTALTLGDYELFTETALDPYAAVKDAYQQYRNGLIEE